MSPVLLAPMAGFSDGPLRRLCHRQGSGLSFTEMADAVGLLRGSSRTLQLLETFPDEGPVVAHLYGNDPVVLGEAAGMVESMGRFVGVDLNAGCPVRKILAKRAGAALMRDPDRLFRILEAMRRGTRLPLMLKTRIGLDADQPDDPGRLWALLDAAAAAGVDVLSLHARTLARGHGGPPDLERLAAARERWSGSLVGNGGIRNGEDARRMFEQTRVDAVMIGRAALGNPWVFGELSAALADHAWQAPDLAARRRLLDAHLADQVAFTRQQIERHPPSGAHLSVETIAVMRFRAHLFRHLQGLRGATRLRAGLNELHDLASVHRAIDTCFATEAAWRTGDRKYEQRCHCR